MKQLYIFGTQNFADMCLYLFTEDSEYRVAGFTVDERYMTESTRHGLPVIPYERFRERVSPEDADLFVAVGIARLNQARAGKVAQVQEDGYRLASFISSRASVPRGFSVGANTMVMDQVNIHPYVTIGTDTIIWSNSRIALKTCIGDHAWVTSAVVGESARIGDYTFVGLNATVAPYVQVGTHNLIGASAVILQNTPDYAVFRGPRSKPARISSERAAQRSLIQ